jgi:hypothetical protein
MTNDRIQHADELSAGLAPYRPALRPCLACGKETLEHHPIVNEVTSVVVAHRRICSWDGCRKIEVFEVEPG